MTDHDRLTRLLMGNRDGFTDKELAARLNIGTRAARKLVAEVVTAGLLPIICDRTKPGDGLYRIALSHEYERVNRENAEDVARAASLHAKARGRSRAMETKYGQSMFVDPISDMDAA